MSELLKGTVYSCPLYANVVFLIHLQFMLKRRCGKGIVWMSVMKCTQTCGRMRREDGPQNMMFPLPTWENVLRMRMFWCTPNDFISHFKYL